MVVVVVFDYFIAELYILSSIQLHKTELVAQSSPILMRKMSRTLALLEVSPAPHQSGDIYDWS